MKYLRFIDVNRTIVKIQQQGCVWVNFQIDHTEKKADNVCNALKYRKTEIVVEIYTLPEQNANNLGNFSESICPELFFINVPLLMNWEMLIPSMTAVDEGLQKKNSWYWKLKSMPNGRPKKENEIL